jgi:hypothetical protein
MDDDFIVVIAAVASDTTVVIVRRFAERREMNPRESTRRALRSNKAPVSIDVVLGAWFSPRRKTASRKLASVARSSAQRHAHATSVRRRPHRAHAPQRIAFDLARERR